MYPSLSVGPNFHNKDLHQKAPQRITVIQRPHTFRKEINKNQNAKIQTKGGLTNTTDGIRQSYIEPAAPCLRRANKVGAHTNEGEGDKEVCMLRRGMGWSEAKWQGSRPRRVLSDKRGQRGVH